MVRMVLIMGTKKNYILREEKKNDRDTEKKMFFFFDYRGFDVSSLAREKKN